MFGGILSFLGGTAFRWLFGEAIGFLKLRQEQQNELARLTLMHAQDKERNEWMRQTIQHAADHQIRLVEAQTEAASAQAADTAFLSAIQGVNAASMRTDWIGMWNASIRPLLATVAIVLIVGLSLAPSVFVITPLVMELCCAVLGVFVGERIRVNNA